MSQEDVISGSGSTPRSPVDPRPRVQVGGEVVVVGVVCSNCGHPLADAEIERCVLCGGATHSASFGPGGTVFSATVLRIGLPGRTPPYGLAYVDLDHGPRILAHGLADSDAVVALTPGARVRLTGTTEFGDPLVELEVPA